MKSATFQVASPAQRITQSSREVRDLGHDEVAVHVLYCGICHTDIHEIDNDWGRSPDFYPFVPGHEVIGEVVARGDSVSNLALGDVVGIGWQSGSCGKCEPCLTNLRQMCSQPAMTYASLNGGFQQIVVAQEPFAVAIPAALHKPQAAPLLCAGITVFSPLLTHNVRSDMRVAVAGLGGLGHLAVKFLHAMGCDVTVVTRNLEKSGAAKEFGARATVSSFSDVGNKLDFILYTAPAPFDVDAAVKQLRPRGILCIVGAIPENLTFNSSAMFDNEAVITASGIGDPNSIATMLEFAAQHDITATCELYEPATINDAVDSVRQGTARYRAVLDMKDLGA